MVGFVEFLLEKQEDDTKSLIALTRVSRNCLGGLRPSPNYSILPVVCCFLWRHSFTICIHILSSRFKALSMILFNRISLSAV